MIRLINYFIVASALLVTISVYPEEASPIQISLVELPVLNQIQFQPNKRTLILLFTPECRYCKQQAILMASLKREYPSAQMVMVGVNASKTELAREVNRLALPLSAFIATPAFLRKIGGVQAVPTSLFLDENHSVLLKHRGALNLTQLTNTVMPFLVAGVGRHKANSHSK